MASCANYTFARLDMGDLGDVVAFIEAESARLDEGARTALLADVFRLVDEGRSFELDYSGGVFDGSDRPGRVTAVASPALMGVLADHGLLAAAVPGLPAGGKGQISG